jgi:transposase-like protein
MEDYMSQMNLKPRFSSEKEAIDYFIKIRYKGIITCPCCGAINKIYRCNDRPKICHCKTCNNSISIFKNTIFEKSKTDLRVWFEAFFALYNDKKGSPALLFQRKINTEYGINITYKCVHQMFGKIRKAMGNINANEIIDCMAESDETYVGPRPPRKKGFKNKKGRGTQKTAIHGIYDCFTKKVYMDILQPNEYGKKITEKQLKANIDKYCKNGITIITDEFPGYNHLDADIPSEKRYIHKHVNHSVDEWSKGDGITVNHIEQKWTYLKRGGLYSRYHNIKKKYLQDYLNEYCFRFNHPKREKAFITFLEQCLVNKPKIMPLLISLTMKCANYIVVDCPVRIQYNNTIEIIDIINMSTYKYKYQGANNKDLFVLERHCGDGFYQRWHFYHDFSVDNALDYMELFDKHEIAA